MYGNVQICAKMYGNEQKCTVFSCVRAEQHLLKIANEFYSLWNFPHCLGAIDVRHIRINHTIQEVYILIIKNSFL